MMSAVISERTLNAMPAEDDASVTFKQVKLQLGEPVKIGLAF